MTFIMPLHEYNITNKYIRNEKSFHLLHKVLLYTTMLLETLRILIIVQARKQQRNASFSSNHALCETKQKNFCPLPQNLRGL